ncbi:LodA/GoxA family CTQ-dependent oxidase [Methylomicrobium sp. Wu6]|uniref:LodA/GoxA family CTQ-dependent oxidase n=1 Tax=Methylomicrobium sp. Wu6 TaxID=3107928 RepID=UPI002DD67A33|nr:LodA/GoxA family CTQ-dependent oxidase [Methylomicrobium sp. Wu6]MEC4749878.1 LodA/GoxA family CTQ-dependent oxidase [Methylomicrobium sp. Wu6]
MNKNKPLAADAEKEDIQIAYCKIFPPIGIARVGDSVQREMNRGWFVDPAIKDMRPDDFRYKDDEGKIKRQAAMFMIIAFDKEDKPLREITSTEADIVWNVHLANKKAAWFNFEGTKTALNAFAAKPNDIPLTIRNFQVGSINLVDNKTSYAPSQDRVDAYEINGGMQEIGGASIESGHKFEGTFKTATHVYLGELQTDASGRLIVLGGQGKSDAVNERGESIKDERWIRNYANNDDWYDDISDGPVTAKVTLKTGGAEVEVRGGAWVLVTPPDFAPDVKNVVSLYDVMEETAFREPSLLNITTPILRRPDQVSFELDIKPLLERMHSQRWVNARGLRGHGTSKAGDFQVENGNSPTLLDPDLSDKNSERGRQLRSRIVSVLRKPAYRTYINGDFSDQYKSPTAISQATTTFMPPLAGDEGDPEDGNPATWLSLTYLQYERFLQWSNNNFTSGVLGNNSDDMESLNSMTRKVLENCAGGAFYPGIEMTCIARDPRLYTEAFRFDHSKVGAGDISKFMALPWQADFWECQQHWWPAQRPDDVITSEELDAVLNKFAEDVEAVENNYEKVLFKRTRWDRGIGIRSRPSNAYLLSRILPEPSEGMSVEDYVTLMSGLSANPAKLKFDSIFSIFRRISGLGAYTDLIDEFSGDGSELASPWRVQYLSQESLDSYSGLYFHLIVASPSEIANILPTDSVQTLDEIRRSWNIYKFQNPATAAKILGQYANGALENLRSQIQRILNDVYGVLKSEPNDKTEKVSLGKFRQFLMGSVAALENEFAFRDFDSKSPEFLKLRTMEMMENAKDALYLRASNWAGDMDMVNEWKKMGFVLQKTVSFDGSGSRQSTNILQYENERLKYDGKSFREYFYYLMNIQDYPDFIPYSKLIAEEILNTAQFLIDQIGIFDADHPESFVQYSEQSFDAKLEEIYEILRSQAATALGWRTGNTRTDVISRIHDRAVFNQTDGAWLRFIANTGAMNKVSSLLFEVWSDEIGNGDPSLHHGNLYTNLLGSLGISLPPVNSRAYADNPDIDESSYIGSVFEMAISQHSEAFFPELIGMTLFLEWEVLSLVPGIRRNDYLGIDSHFWKMHVGIDNSTHGHGAKAKEATKLYLDGVLKDSGAKAVQEEWKRIWRGFVAFATAGYGYFTNIDGVDTLTLTRKHKGNPEEAIIELIGRKAHYGALNHTGKSLGGHRLNDLFEEPRIFVAELAASPYVTPGRPDESKLLNYLTTFEGPMYKVFDERDLELWRQWIAWLGESGDTDSNKTFLTKAQSMFLLMQELRELARSSGGHKRYKVEKASKKKTKEKNEKQLIANFFENGDIEGLMRALKEPENGWVIPYDPGSSPMILDLARVNNPMGAALDRRFPKLGNQIGRIILINWIEAGCPIPGEPTPEEPKSPPSKVWEGKKLLVQQIGMGAVH